MSSGSGFETGISFRKKRVSSCPAALAVMGGFDFYPRVGVEKVPIWRLLWEAFYFVREHAKSTEHPEGAPAFEVWG